MSVELVNAIKKMEDRVDRIEKMILDIYRRIDNNQDRLHNHIQDSDAHKI